jgi:hypothetical protein
MINVQHLGLHAEPSLGRKNALYVEVACSSDLPCEMAPELSDTRQLSAGPTCQLSDGSRINETGLLRNILTPSTPMVLYVSLHSPTVP